MGMVMVHNKAFDLDNIVLLELREPHGDDRHPYVAATFHSGQTIEVTSPLTPDDGTALAVMGALMWLVGSNENRLSAVITRHDVLGLGAADNPDDDGVIRLRNGQTWSVADADMLAAVHPMDTGGPAAAVLVPRGNFAFVAHVVAL